MVIFLILNLFRSFRQQYRSLISYAQNFLNIVNVTTKTLIKVANFGYMEINVFQNKSCKYNFNSFNFHKVIIEDLWWVVQLVQWNVWKVITLICSNRIIHSFISRLVQGTLQQIMDFLKIKLKDISEIINDLYLYEGCRTEK